jgi:hypothetical protein
MIVSMLTSPVRRDVDVGTTDPFVSRRIRRSRMLDDAADAITREVGGRVPTLLQAIIRQEQWSI